MEDNEKVEQHQPDMDFVICGKLSADGAKATLIAMRSLQEGSLTMELTWGKRDRFGVPDFDGMQSVGSFTADDGAIINGSDYADAFRILLDRWGPNAEGR